MRFNSPKVIFWYSLAAGISAAALLFAYAGFMLSLLGLGMVSAVSYLVLVAACRYDEENSPYLQFSEQIGVVGLVLFLPLMLFFKLLIALLVFIAFAYLALLFQTHDYRRFHVGLMVSFIALMAGAVESKSGFYLVYFLAYTVSVSMALGYAHIEPLSGNRSDWRIGDRLSASTWLVVTAGVIYLLLPRLPAGGLGAQPGSDHFYRNTEWESEASNLNRDALDNNPAQSLLERLAAEEDTGEGSSSGRRSTGNGGKAGEGFHYRGFEQEMDINNPDAGGQRFSNAIVARMRGDRPLYLRARIFDRFDGVKWYSSAERLEKLKLHRGELELRRVLQHEREKIERYEVFVEQNLGDYVAAAAVPVKVKFPGTVVAIDAFGQLHAPTALRQGSAYAIESQRNAHRGRSFAEMDYVALSAFTQLPDDFDPRIAALASRVAQGHATDFDVAIALEQHLRSSYDYDFSSVFTSQNRTPLSQFLFETKRGHCEYFASALAIMLRTQGIPSRLVTGFSATNLNPLTGYYDIYALDGHAWVEAYVDGIGWLELEPTAYYDGPSVDNRTLSAEQINDYVERQLRLQQVMGDEALSLETVFSALWQGAYLTLVWLGAYLKLFLMQTWQWLLGIGVLVVSGRLAWPYLRPLWCAYKIRKRLGVKLRNMSESSVDHYLQAIDELLQNAGYQRPPGLTIEGYLEKLEELKLTLDENRMSGHFNGMHYGRKTAHADPSDYKSLFEALYGLGYKGLKQRVAALDARQSDSVTL